MSADFSLGALRFGVACAGSLFIAIVLLAMLRLAASRWPALLVHRSVWLLAQASVALLFVLACMPLPRVAVVPTLTLAAPAVITSFDETDDDGQAPAQHAASVGVKPAAPQTDAGSLAATALRWLPCAWLAAYLVGLAWHATQRLRTQRRWQVLLRHAKVVGALDLQALSGMSPEQRERIAQWGITVRTTDLPVSPMLHGLRSPCLLLPAHMNTLDVGQQRLIVEHELTHWRRSDPLWLALSAAFALLFWFNRPVQRLGQTLREAVELGCDDAVLAGRTSVERQSYAAALVAQLRLQLQRDTGAVGVSGAAFGSFGVTERVQRMRNARPPRLSMHARLLIGAAVTAVAVAAAALQPAVSSAAAPTRVALTDAASRVAPQQEEWRYPLEQVRVTSLHGVTRPGLSGTHHGVDFAARRATPVFAVAGGRVVEAAANPVWGNYVRVDHGEGRSSLLIHLDRISVAPGRRVDAGDFLGTSGASGKATGPHLHLEYWQNGRRLDPALMLADLPDHATPQALARRAAKGNPLPTDL